MRNYLLLMMLIVASCSDGGEFYPTIDNCDWETSLKEIMSDNKNNFQYKDIEIVSSKLLKDVNVDSTLFFGDKYGYYPIYSKKDSVFEVINYKRASDLKSNSTISQEVSSKINNLIERSDDYDVIELSWRYKTDFFKSIALFNKRTGELEYDNMLFNMETIQRYSGENFAHFLSNSETVGVDTDYHDSKSVQWVQGARTVAWAGITWSAKGYWTASTLYYYEDEEYRYYISLYNYTCTESEISGGGYAESGSEYFIEYRDNTVPLQPRYNFRYAIWAGPKDHFDRVKTFNLQTMSFSEMQTFITSGNWDFAEVIGPDRNIEPQLIRVHK